MGIGKQNMDQLVSIIVPLYNAEKWIDRGVACLLGQTHQNIEILLVDDGSTDHSEAICRSWEQKDARIRYYRMEQNSGAGPTRNFGIAHAGGEYITFFDIDDLCNAQMIGDNLHLAVTHNADITMWGVQNVRGEEEVIQMPTQQEVIVMNGKEMIRNQWLSLRFSGKSYHTGAPWNKLYRKAFLEEHHLQFPDVRRLEDTSFNIDCVRCADTFLFNPQVYYYYFFNSVEVFWKKVQPDFWTNVISYAKAFDALLLDWAADKATLQNKIDNDFFGHLYSAIEACKNPKWKFTLRKKAGYIKGIINNTYVMQRCKDAKVDDPEFILFTRLVEKKATMGIWGLVYFKPTYYKVRRALGKLLKPVLRR